MTFPLWRYGAYAVAIAATLCLAAANVAWAWSLDDGAYRYVMIVLSIAADVGAICALMAVFHYQAEGDAVSVAAAVAIWGACGYAEVKGAEVWLKANSFVISAPAAKAGEERKAASAELDAETVNLAEIRKLLASERREARLDSLQRREKTALERIERLRPQTFAAAVEPARSQYADNELAIAFALWLLSQLAWRMAVGRLHGAAAAVRFRVLESQPESDGNGFRRLPETSGNGGPDGKGGGKRPEAQLIDGLENGSPLAEISGQFPDGGKSARFIPRIVPKDDFARKVLDYRRAGLTVAQIAKKMGCGKTKIYDALKPAVVTGATGDRR